MVKHFVLLYDPILHPRTFRTPPVSSRSLTSGVPRARTLASPLGTASIRRPQRLRTTPHSRRLASTSRPRHSRRALSRSPIHAPHRSLPGRRQFRHLTLPAAPSSNRSPAASLAPAPARPRLLPLLALAPAPPLLSRRTLPRRIPLVRSPPPLRQHRRLPCPNPLLLLSNHDSSQRRLAH
jgi:hypothetical protein